MLHLIEATRFHLNGELTEHDLWLKQKFERVQWYVTFDNTVLNIVSCSTYWHLSFVFWLMLNLYMASHLLAR